MMVKVWNDNTEDFKQTFRDKNYLIPAKKFIELEYDEAHLFHGAFSPIERGPDGNALITSYKMLRIEEPPIEQVLKKNEPDPLMCIACRYLATDKKDHMKHIIEAHSDDHVSSLEEVDRKVTKRHKE